MTSLFHSSTFIIHPFMLVLAFVLDLAIGDPRWLPHPVRIIGYAISSIEKILRRYFKTSLQEKFAGILLAILIVVPVFLLAAFISSALNGGPDFTFERLLGMAALICLVSTTIAVKELIGSARLVIQAIKGNGIEEARSRLSMIVGRDTNNLSDREILKATMETLAENLSDGVIAPIFYLVIGGLPLALAYKAINTLDSMVGYKNDRYLYFGWASARLDDAANYVPARITGILIAASVFFVSLLKTPGSALGAALDSLRTLVRDGSKHSSPNSGIPEAAMSGALGIRMGGPSSYGGIIIKKPFIGENRTEDYMAASENTINIVRAASVITITFAAIILYMRDQL